MDSYSISAVATELPHVGFYRLQYDKDVFSQRSDIGCVGGKILNKKHRLAGGMYRKDGTLIYDNLPEGYSGGYQHRAVLQQDACAVDIRCLFVRSELIPLYEEVTGMKYLGTGMQNKGDPEMNIAAPGGDEGVALGNKSGYAADPRFAGMSREEIARMSLRLCSEIRRRGYRVLWDPQIVVQC
jgi:hypothetical protein